MIEALYVVAGLVVGGLVGWLIASRSHAGTAAVVQELRARLAQADEAVRGLQASLDTERRARTASETKLDETNRNLAEQKQFLDEARKALTDAFQALSGEALKSNNQAFLELAKKSMEVVLAEARGDLGKRQESIGALVKPLGEALKRYEEQIKQIESSRQKAYGGLEEQLKSLSAAHQQLQKETGNLVTALRAPQVRGRWGEVTLRRVVELSGMSAHCDFSEQVSTDTDEGRLRPDLVVQLPAGRQIVVDAKTSLDAYLAALEAETDEARRAALARHAQQVRTHMQQLAAKSYWSQFDSTPEIVVLFIPGESFFAAAIDVDRTLIEDAMARRVVIATPTTLIALLRAVAYGWRQEQVAENAQRVSELGRELYDRLRTFATHLLRLRKALAAATDAFNNAVGSVESRVFPAARRFHDLGAASGDEILRVEPITTSPRALEAVDADAEATDAPPESDGDTPI